MIVQAASLHHLGWIERKTGCVLTRNARAIEALNARGEIRGMVAYDNWTVNSVQAHMAVESPIVWRHLLRPAFQYPFVQAGKGVLLGVICADNERSLSTALSMGFRQTHRVKDGWTKGVDLCLIEMRHEDCMWLETSRGKASAPGA